MQALDSEKNILNVIKYGAVIPIILFSIILTYFLIQEKNSELKKEIDSIRSKYLLENKKNVKDEVLRVINAIEKEIEKQDKSLKLLLKEKVYEAHSIATHIYNEESSHQNGHSHSKEHIWETLKHALGGMIYNNGRGYIFIDDINGVKLLQPFNKELEGKNLLEFEDAKGYKFVKKIVQTIKNKTENYDKYYWYKSNDTTKTYEKMSFYKYFEPFNVAIGTGEYLVDYEKKLQKNILEKIKDIRFGNNGYIFAFDNLGTYLSHFKEEKIGTNGFKVKDDNGDFFIKDIVDFAKQNHEGYYSYIATAKPNQKTKKREKISYVIHFEKWDWVLGAGFYLEELNNDIKDKESSLIQKHQNIINGILSLSLIITIILLLISFYASKIIKNKFTIYKRDIKKEIENSIEKEKLLVQQSKMATMGEMIGNISHQWRQPLSTISTAATGSKIQKEMDCLSDKEFFNAMDAINDSAQYLSETIEDFRNFFKPTKIHKTFKIKKLFEKTSKLLSSQFKNYNIKIIEDIEENEFTGHENELLQVIINILKNAKDELVKKEPNEERIIFIKSYKNENNIFIKIKDNAGGINQKIQNKIFEPYITTKSSEEGTGIGLYMSKQIIEGMNGELKVSNENFLYDDIKYIGAEFTIVLKV